jgi:hypothetical protein
MVAWANGHSLEGGGLFGRARAARVVDAADGLGDSATFGLRFAWGTRSLEQ